MAQQPPEHSPLEQLIALSEEPEDDGSAVALAQPKTEQESKSIGLSVLAGVLTGIVSLVKVISYAALMFSGILSPFLSVGLGVLLISNIVVRVVTSLTSSFPPVIYNPQSEQVVILTFMVGAIADQLFGKVSSDALVATVVGAIALSTVLTGIGLMLLGTFKQGNLGRYLPYPITGGFLAGISWLLVIGGFKLITGQTWRWGRMFAVLNSNVGLQLLAGLLFAALLWLVTRRLQNSLTMPVLFAAAVVAFYLIAGLAGFSVDEIRSTGWLVNLSTRGTLWPAIEPATVSEIDWSVVRSQAGAIGTLIFLSTLSLLLGATNLELFFDREIDLNQELKSVGTANILAGCLGGATGGLSFSSTLLGYRLGGRTRWVGLSGAALYCTVFFIGSSFISYLPRFALGGFLIFSGMDVLSKWLYASWFKLPKDEYAIALIVFGSIVFTDLITGVGIGLLLAVGLFVVSYSRISPSRYELFGDEYKSNLIRPKAQEDFLASKSNQIYIVKLQGFLFFGTANRLFNQIKEQVQHSQQRSPTRFIILDFRLVRGIDFSSTLSFEKLKATVQKNQAVLLFTGLSPKLIQVLRQAKILDRDDTSIQLFGDIDRGFEWCEEMLLSEAQWRRQRFFPMAMQLEEIFEEDDIETFVSYLKKLEFSTGEMVSEPGKIYFGLYFVEVGQVSLITDLPDGSTKRLQTFSAGTLCGQLDASEDKESANRLIAEQDSQLYFLSTAAFNRMEQEDSRLANILLRSLLRSQKRQITSYEKELRNFIT